MQTRSELRQQRPIRLFVVVTVVQSCQRTRFRRVTHAFACFHTHSRHTSNFSRQKKKSDFGPRRVRSFSNSLRSASVTLFAAQTCYLPPISPEVSDRRRVTKRDKRGRNSGREYIAEENLHLKTVQRLSMLMTCGSIRYSLS